MHKVKRGRIKLLIFIWGILFSQASFGSIQSDSLQKILNSSNQSEKSELLYQYGISLRKKDTIELYLVAKELFDHATRTSDKVGTSYAHALFVRYYSTKDDYGNVLHHSMLAINQKCPDTLEACVKIRQSTARILSSIGQTQEALSQQFEVLVFYKSKKNYPKISKTSGEIGRLYLAQNKITSALSYYHLSIESLKKSENKKSVRNAYNSMGLVFQELELYDSALVYFQKGLDSYKLHPIRQYQDSATFGLISGNMGGVHFTLGNYEKALELLNIDKKFNSKRGGNLSSFNACLMIARIHLFKKNKQESLLNLLEAERILIERNYSRPKYVPLYKGFVETYQALRNHEKSEYYFAQYTHLNDSLQKASKDKQETMQLAFINEIMMRELELNQIANERKEQEITSLEQQKSIGEYRILALIGTILIIVVFSILFFIRFRSNVKKRHEINKVKGQLIKAELVNKELEQSLLQEELGVKNNQLTNLALDISRKHDFTDSLIDRLKRLRKKSSPEMVEEMNDLMIFARNELNIDKSLHELQENIAKINYSFFENLENCHPELTKTEKYICGLLRLELSNNEIAILREVTVDSVKVSKNRLRRKMGLEQRTNLTSYLRSL